MFPRFVFLLILFLASHLVSAQMPAAVPFRSVEKWGLSDSTGRIIINPQYDDVRFYFEDRNWLLCPAEKLFFSADSGHTHLLINGRGKIVCRYGDGKVLHSFDQNAHFAALSDASQVLFAIDSVYRYQSLINGSGNVIVPFGNHLVHDIGNQQFFAAYSNAPAEPAATVYDKKGRRRFSIRASSLMLSGNAFLTDSLGKMGIRDSAGNMVVPCGKYSSFDYHGSAIVLRNAFRQQGLFSATQARIIIPAVYDSIIIVPNGEYIVMANGKYGVCDRNGKPIIPLAKGTLENDGYTCGLYWRNISSSNQNKKLILVGENGKQWAKPALPKPLETLIDLSVPQNRFVFLRSGKFYSVYDIVAGKTVGPANCDTAFITAAEKPVIVFSCNKKPGLIDDQGRMLIAPENWPLQDGKFFTTPLFGKGSIENYSCCILDSSIIGVKENKYGVIGFHGETIIPFRYDTIFSNSDLGLYYTRSGKHYLVFNAAGLPDGYYVPGAYYSSHTIAAADGSGKTSSVLNNLENESGKLLFAKGKYTGVKPVVASGKVYWELRNASDRITIANDSGRILLPDTFLRSIDTISITRESASSYNYHFYPYIALESRAGIQLYDPAQNKLSSPFDSLESQLISGFETGIGAHVDNMLVMHHGKLKGMMNIYGEELVPATYIDITKVPLPRSKQIWACWKTDRTKESINSVDIISGGVILDQLRDTFFYFSMINPANPIYIIARRDEKCGALGKHGKVILPAKFYALDFFMLGNDDCLISIQDGQRRIYDRTGRLVFDKPVSEPIPATQYTGPIYVSDTKLIREMDPATGRTAIYKSSTTGFVFGNK